MSCRYSDAEDRDDRGAETRNAVHERLGWRLVDQRVQRGENEEGAREDERTLLARRARDPRENRGLGRPGCDQRRAVERERERHAGEPETDRNQQGCDLARHPLAEPEASEDDVRDRECRAPRPWHRSRNLVRRSEYQPTAAANPALTRRTDADDGRSAEVGTRSSYPIAATTNRHQYSASTASGSTRSSRSSAQNASCGAVSRNAPTESQPQRCQRRSPPRRRGRSP